MRQPTIEQNKKMPRTICGIEADAAVDAEAAELAVAAPGKDCWAQQGRQTNVVRN